MGPRHRRLPLAVDILPVTDPDDADDEHGVDNGVEDAMVADADAVLVAAAELPDARRPRLGSQRLDCRIHPAKRPPVGLRELAKVAFRCRREFDGIPGHAGLLQAEFLAKRVVGGTIVALRERLADRVEVSAIFQQL